MDVVSAKPLRHPEEPLEKRGSFYYWAGAKFATDISEYKYFFQIQENSGNP